MTVAGSFATDQVAAPPLDQLPGRIGINALFLLPGMGGLETYVRELVPELVHATPTVRYSVFCSPAGERLLRQCEWSDEVRFVSHPMFGVRGLKAFVELTALGAVADRRVDLLHSVALTAPWRMRAVSVVTIADVTWILDPRPDPTTRLWRVLVPPAARRAERIIAISHASADHIVEHLAIPAERIDVTLLGHAHKRLAPPLLETAVRARFGLAPGPIVLTVGTRKRHKNLLRLIEAMPAVLEVRPDATLVLAGNPTAHEQELHQAADRLELRRSVAFLPFVDASELEGLYAAADCFILPSTNEGFGLPLLEAMGRGVPVACSAISALPEVAGEAARYFDPADIGQIAAAIIEVLTDRTLRERLSELGSQRERQLTWQATASATLWSYAQAWRSRQTG